MIRHRKIVAGMLAWWTTSAAIAAGQSMRLEQRRPADFVDAGKAIPAMQLDMRYVTAHNFVGRRIRGYEQAACLLTSPTVAALKKVEDELLAMGLTLKAYDCYRPQSAVDDFVSWAANANEHRMQAEFYPGVGKDRLFEQGYIAAHSGHSRGSTIDLTIVPVGSKVPDFPMDAPLLDCANPRDLRAPDNSLDFGTGFDCFSPVSHPSYQGIAPQAKANRMLLQSLMIQAGFVPLETEWWHFTLKNEPYPATYFDFPVRHGSPE